MRAPIVIAVVSSAALSVTAALMQLVVKLWHRPSGSPLPWLSEILLESILLGLVVSVGTYLGARMTPPRKRTSRFIYVLSISYVAIGAFMSLPIESHAVKLDMPRPGATSNFDTVDILGPLMKAIGTLILIVLLPLVVTRVLGVICSRRTFREA